MSPGPYLVFWLVLMPLFGWFALSPFINPLVTLSHSLIMWLIILSLLRREEFTFIPKRGFDFRTCEDGAGWHLVPYRISPRSEFFPQSYKNWHIMWGINLWLDWPPLARGCKFHTIHTPTKATKLPPLDNGRYGPLGWDVIIFFFIVVGNSGFPCDILKESLGQF